MRLHTVAAGIRLAICLAISALPRPVLAAEPQCHANEGFLVVVQEYEDEPGSQFAVSVLDGSAAPQDCLFDPAQAGVVIGEKGDPLWFAELTSDFLIATRSTGPQGDLVVFALPSGEAVLDVPAGDYAVEDGSISFWQRGAQATEENCPQFAEHRQNGLGSVISEHAVFDLDARVLEKTGDVRCDATQ